MIQADTSARTLYLNPHLTHPLHTPIELILLAASGASNLFGSDRNLDKINPGSKMGHK